MMTRDRKGIVMRIAAAAALGMAGCATVPETALPVPEVEGDEEEVVCSGACEEEWGRAEEWIKKYSGYPFPAEVTVTPDRIEAARLPMRDCESRTANAPLVTLSRPAAGERAARLRRTLRTVRK